MVTRKTSATNENRLKIENRAGVTIKGIANSCLVSRCTVRRWIKDGKLDALRLPGGHYRVTNADFKDFIKQYGMSGKEL